MKYNCPNCNIPLFPKANGFVQCPECPFNAMPNEKILKDLYAWVSIDPSTQCEGIIATGVGNRNLIMPLVSSNFEMIKKMSPMDGLKTGMSSGLLRFKRVGYIK